MEEFNENADKDNETFTQDGKVYEQRYSSKLVERNEEREKKLSELYNLADKLAEDMKAELEKLEV